MSAHECADSAIIDAEPVTSAATILATAIARLAKKAMTTVRVDSPPDVAASDSSGADVAFG